MHCLSQKSQTVALSKKLCKTTVKLTTCKTTVKLRYNKTLSILIYSIGFLPIWPSTSNGRRNKNKMEIKLHITRCILAIRYYLTSKKVLSYRLTPSNITGVIFIFIFIGLAPLADCRIATCHNNGRQHIINET